MRKLGKVQQKRTSMHTKTRKREKPEIESALRGKGRLRESGSKNIAKWYTIKKSPVESAPQVVQSANRSGRYVGPLIAHAKPLKLIYALKHAPGC